MKYRCNIDATVVINAPCEDVWNRFQKCLKEIFGHWEGFERSIVLTCEEVEIGKIDADWVWLDIELEYHDGYTPEYVFRLNFQALQKVLEEEFGVGNVTTPEPGMWVMEAFPDPPKPEYELEWSFGDK